MRMVRASWRFVTLALCGAGLMMTLACGSDEKDDDDDDDETAGDEGGDTTELAYSDIKSIVDENCATSGCHNGTRISDFRSQAGFDAYKATSKAYIQAGTMPEVGSPEATAITAAEKEKLIEYLGQ